MHTHTCHKLLTTTTRFWFCFTGPLLWSDSRSRLVPPGANFLAFLDQKFHRPDVLPIVQTTLKFVFPQSYSRLARQVSQKGEPLGTNTRTTNKSIYIYYIYIYIYIYMVTLYNFQFLLNWPIFAEIAPVEAGAPKHLERRTFRNC